MHAGGFGEFGRGERQEIALSVQKAVLPGQHQICDCQSQISAAADSLLPKTRQDWITHIPANLKPRKCWVTLGPPARRSASSYHVGGNAGRHRPGKGKAWLRVQPAYLPHSTLNLCRRKACISRQACDIPFGKLGQSVQNGKHSLCRNPGIQA